MDKSPAFFILSGLIGSIMGFICLYRIIKEIRTIKINSDDGTIIATVVDAHVFTTGDVRPILLYTVNGENKKYTYHFYHRLKEFPIGKEVELRLSRASGLAYDKKDLIQGILMNVFSIIFVFGGFLLFLYYYLCLA